MNLSTQNISLADYYYSFLKNLNPESKLDLIAKLSHSLQVGNKGENTSLQSLFGAYKSDESAEEIIAELRASRTFNRNTERL